MPRASTRDRDGGEDRLAAERGEAVARVLDQVLDPPRTAIVAMDLLHLLDAAELPPGFAARLDRIEPARDRIAFRQLEMRDHFVVELALDARRSEQGEQAREPAFDGHALASRMRATSAAACSQLATSTCSCFAPARVSE